MLEHWRLGKSWIRDKSFIVDGWFSKLQTAILAVSHDCKQDLVNFKRIRPEKIVVVQNGRCLDAFEPQPENHARLQVNLRRNGLADMVKVHNLALLDSNRSVEIHSTVDSDPNHGSASLFVEAGSETRASAVEGVRMDQVLAQTRPRLIKLDIEGAEALAVEGMKGLLAGSTPPVVIAEYNAEAAQV